jgi:hypothetical protein
MKCCIMEDTEIQEIHAVQEDTDSWKYGEFSEKTLLENLGHLLGISQEILKIVLRRSRRLI